MHGSVFQPFIDHWCEATQKAIKEPMMTTEHAHDFCHNNPLPYPPLVWMTANEQCEAAKPAKFRYQVPLIHAVSRAALSAGERYGLPVLEWNTMMTQSRRSINHNVTSDVCRLTLDGVHVPHTVDHLRAAILLHYTCGSDGRWRTPCVNPAKTAAQCARDGQLWR